MRQFLEVKEGHPEGIVFFRMGDFYEMFFEDAVLAAKLLDITLTSRDKGKEDAIPMAGIPHHAAKGYIARLTTLGHKVVLVEQTEDPKQAKGLVKREVVRIITPGVVTDDDVLDPKSALYVAAVAPAAGARPKGYGLAYVDVSTGEFRKTCVTTMDELISEVARVGPREIVGLPKDLEKGGRLARLLHAYRAAVYTPRAAPADWPAHGAEALADGAADAVLDYARATQPVGVLPVESAERYRPGDSVVLDDAAVQNLELTQTLIGQKREGSLLGTVDRTLTAPGGRLLKRWLLYPLTLVAAIRRRQDAVEFLVDRAIVRGELRSELRGVSDLERLAGRFSLGVASPRDLGRLRDSLARVPSLVAVLAGAAEKEVEIPEALGFSKKPLETLAKLAAELERAVVDDPPLQTKDGGIIRDGFCPEVDETRMLSRGGKEAILAVETRERERTGIPSLKVKYNKVFGYYIEVTKSYLARVPEDYVRKQTIATGERYVTGELAELEGAILASDERLIARELVLFGRLKALVVEHTKTLLSVAERIASLDCLAGLAELAHDRGYVRPLVDESSLLSIERGRHPVVEEAVGRDSYVPNSCELSTDERQILLITGPNMAGKSTYMRQVAHIVLLAQVGSFVPAESAHIGCVDRIFTRVGAADNLARGESTFMVEMREAAAILANATERSLVVLDEIGRGTSTFDGLSIAWSVTEFIHDQIGARTLFATHYHELCSLSDTLSRVENVSVAVSEQDGDVVFLREVVPGGASRSYGIDVARLAGLPSAVTDRAREVLAELEGTRLASGPQLSLFTASPKSARSPDGTREKRPAPKPEDPRRAVEAKVARGLRELDVDQITPLGALTLLAEWRAQLTTQL